MLKDNIEYIDGILTDELLKNNQHKEYEEASDALLEFVHKVAQEVNKIFYWSNQALEIERRVGTGDENDQIKQIIKTIFTTCEF